MNIVQKMAAKFEQNRIALKVMEEMAELNEVLIKRETKSEKLRPPVEKVVEEIGDLLFRLDILIESMEIEEQVKYRYKEKSAQISKWFKEEYELKTN